MILRSQAEVGEEKYSPGVGLSQPESYTGGIGLILSTCSFGVHCSQIQLNGFNGFNQIAVNWQ